MLQDMRGEVRQPCHSASAVQMIVQQGVLLLSRPEMARQPVTRSTPFEPRWLGCLSRLDFRGAPAGSLPLPAQAHALEQGIMQGCLWLCMAKRWVLMGAVSSMHHPPSSTAAAAADQAADWPPTVLQCRHTRKPSHSKCCSIAMRGHVWDILHNVCPFVCTGDRETKGITDSTRMGTALSGQAQQQQTLASPGSMQSMTRHAGHTLAGLSVPDLKS